MQTTSSILMIRPHAFLANPETMDSNTFQKPSDQNEAEVNHSSLLEFDQMVQILKNNGLNILVFNDPGDCKTPDSIFPNNWVSFHHSGLAFLYPMQAENRRLERRIKPIENLLKKNNFQIHSIVDLSKYEKNNQFLEGTGSMVLDRNYKIAYACLSPRTNERVLNEFCEISGFYPFIFEAGDELEKPIYHTNVMMCVGIRFVLVCLDSIRDLDQRNRLVKKVNETGKTLIEISFEQMNHFAGNMLEVMSVSGENMIILSEQALKILREDQIKRLESFGRLIPIPLFTIEKNGGGSARCMMAEIHLPNLEISQFN